MFVCLGHNLIWFSSIYLYGYINNPNLNIGNWKCMKSDNKPQSLLLHRRIQLSHVIWQLLTIWRLLPAPSGSSSQKMAGLTDMAQHSKRPKYSETSVWEPHICIIYIPYPKKKVVISCLWLHCYTKFSSGSTTLKIMQTICLIWPYSPVAITTTDNS